MVNLQSGHERRVQHTTNRCKKNNGGNKEQEIFRSSDLHWSSGDKRLDEKRETHAKSLQQRLERMENNR